VFSGDLDATAKALQELPYTVIAAVIGQSFLIVFSVCSLVFLLFLSGIPCLLVPVCHLIVCPVRNRRLRDGRGGWRSDNCQTGAAAQRPGALHRTVLRFGHSVCVCVSVCAGYALRLVI